jgi:uncharacterized FlaG/YvyC family protein
MEEYQLAQVRRLQVEVVDKPAVTFSPFSGETRNLDQAAVLAANQAHKKAEAEGKSAPLVSNMTDSYLKFKVDPKTNSITVYVLDRTTKKILRTIPPEELGKMASGDLLELFA